MRLAGIGLLAALSLSGQQPVLGPNGTASNHFYNLEYDQAIADLEKAIVADPNNATYRNAIAQSIEFRELFRVGALESELVSGANSFMRRPKIDTTQETENRFMAEIQKAMDLCEAALKKNPKDTEALYTEGVSYALRGNWNFLVRKAWRDALRDATTARKLHNRVSELDPSNVDARLVQGVHDYIVGSLPALYKMVGFLVGFRGDKQRGIQTLELVGQKGKHNALDAKVLLCAIYRREQEWQHAAPILDELIPRFPRNYLLRFEQAQMYSSMGQKDKAIDALRQVAELKNSGAPGFAHLAMEKIYFQIGNIEFWYRDYDQAIDNLKKATAGGAALDLNTGSMAWMRLGQVYDLTNRRTMAAEAYRKAIAFAPQAEAAKESQRYLSSPYRRVT